MNLRDFISQTVSDIVLGIEDAALNLSDKNQKVRLFSPGKSDVRHVEFDVAVTVSNKKGADIEGGGEIKVWGIGQIGSNAKIKQDILNSTVSRVKFGVRIDKK